MAASFRLFHVAAVLWRFSSLVAALPPIIQPRTTPNPPAPLATQITTTSLALASTDTIRSATPTRTATDVPTPFPSFWAPDPPPATPIAGHDSNAHLELRADLAILVTGTTTSADPSSPITLLTLPSGFSNAQEWQEKWYQTTYWSCVTNAVQTHCGWHEPVLPGGDNSVAGATLERRPRPVVAAGVAVVGAVLVAVGWGVGGGWGL